MQGEGNEVEKGSAAPKGFALIRWKFVRKSHGLWSCCCFHIDIDEKGKIFAFAPWFIHTSFTAFASGCLFALL